METILALIFTYLVFVTRTWWQLRLLVLVDAAVAVLHDFTPLGARFGVVLTVLLIGTLIAWGINLARDRA